MPSAARPSSGFAMHWSKRSATPSWSRRYTAFGPNRYMGDAMYEIKV